MSEYKHLICVDCDHLERDCSCESRLRCSCGIPTSVCVCAYGPEADRDYEDTDGQAADRAG